jgi:uncharacterized protein YjbI with pentapeptide repeats
MRYVKFIIDSSALSKLRESTVEEHRVNQQQSPWWPTRRQLLWAGAISALAFLIIVICGYLFGWKWTGLVKDADFHSRTFWDWLQLLIVPAVLAAGGVWFNLQQREREQQIANDRAQDEALQAYLDQMSQLLTDEKRPLRRTQQGDNLNVIARARTLTVLQKLGPARKRSTLHFLYESGLVGKQLVVSLADADLSGADLSGTILSGANLSGANLSEANLSRAYLSGTNLSDADLSRANLSDANLVGANLSEANVRAANLSGTYLSGADLNGADLSGVNLAETYLGHANLSDAYLSGANLSGANLGGADLIGAYLGDTEGVTEKQLEQASLTKATMPNGQKYEEQPQYKEDSAEDGESTGPP